MKQSIAKFLATGAYIGLVPFMPGTFGTLWGVVLAYPVSRLGPVYAAIAIICCTLVAIPISAVAETALGKKDPSSIVIDEIAGFLVAMFLIPFTLINVIIVFLLFRFFDIVKPYPISLADKRLHGGLGIVLDDIIAGVFANIAIRIILTFL
ncbi:MAG: phosphatidylglycerophosphatase A [Thermodesulfobacteriota bacterium]